MPKYSDDSKFARWLKLIHILSVRPGQTGAKLARELGCSSRTIYRDVQELGQNGFSIYSDEGYHLAGDTFLPPLNFTLPEILALLLGLRVLENSSEEPLRTAGRFALEKVQRVVSEPSRPVLRSLRDHIDVAAAQAEGQVQRPAYLESIVEAILAKRKIRLEYLSLDRPDAITREVDPWGVFYYGDALYVHGFDHHHGEPRNFRLTRIESLAILPVEASIPSEFSVQSAVFHRWDLGGDEPVQVELQVTPRLARWLTENPQHPSQQVGDGIARYVVSQPAQMARWILGLDAAEVLAPESLRAAVAERARQLASTHQRRGKRSSEAD